MSKSDMWLKMARGIAATTAVVSLIDPFSEMFGSIRKSRTEMIEEITGEKEHIEPGYAAVLHLLALPILHALASFNFKSTALKITQQSLLVVAFVLCSAAFVVCLFTLNPYVKAGTHALMYVAFVAKDNDFTSERLDRWHFRLCWFHGLLFTFTLAASVLQLVHLQKQMKQDIGDEANQTEQDLEMDNDSFDKTEDYEEDDYEEEEPAQVV